MRPCDLTLDSNTALLLDAGPRLVLWLGANVAAELQRSSTSSNTITAARRAVDAVAAGASSEGLANVPAVVRVAAETARTICATPGRFPVPELLVCLEGHGQERHAIARLAPTVQDSQEEIFAQLPHLARLHAEDAQYTAAMLTHIARRLPPTDNPSFVEWCDNLAVDVRPALRGAVGGSSGAPQDQHALDTPGQDTSATKMMPLNGGHNGHDLSTQLAAARLSAVWEAKAQAQRPRVHLTAPVDRSLMPQRKAEQQPAEPQQQQRQPPQHTSSVSSAPVTGRHAPIPAAMPTPRPSANTIHLASGHSQPPSSASKSDTTSAPPTSPPAGAASAPGSNERGKYVVSSAPQPAQMPSSHQYQRQRYQQPSAMHAPHQHSSTNQQAAQQQPHSQRRPQQAQIAGSRPYNLQSPLPSLHQPQRSAAAMPGSVNQASLQVRPPGSAAQSRNSSAQAPAAMPMARPPGVRPPALFAQRSDQGRQSARLQSGARGPHMQQHEGPQ